MKLSEEEWKNIDLPGPQNAGHNVTCFHCNLKGHYANNCPTKNFNKPGILG